MAALLDSLITGTDTFEVIRDKLAEILVTESAAQQVFAEDADEDSRLWALRVFVERSNPWSQFPEPSDDTSPNEFAIPIVNVSFDADSSDMAASNLIERQKMVGTFHVDCYGFGHASETDEGHRPGDYDAELHAHRAARLVRKILMSGPYTYLGLTRGTIWRRWLNSRTAFEVAIDNRSVQNVAAVRLAFQIEYSEFSPQLAAETLESVNLTVIRSETGEVYLTAHYEDS